jgi:hypothetical protein
MPTAYVLDTPENLPIVHVAERDERVLVNQVGPYFELVSEVQIEVDRRATGCRHAVWYSCVSGLVNSQILQWDKDALRIGSK